jgi:hypothetical protein
LRNPDRLPIVLALATRGPNAESEGVVSKLARRETIIDEDKARSEIAGTRHIGSAATP